jgi:hypoxanthine phosphoribosyltransferase
VLLSKRKHRARDVDADYIGFEIDDEFVVDYGLDFMERYRNLPYDISRIPEVSKITRLAPAA